MKTKLFLRIAMGSGAAVFLIVCNVKEVSSAAATLVVLGAACVLFVSEAIPLGITAILCPLALNLAGAIDTKTALSGLSNENVVLFAAMFVVGSAIFRTGVAKTIGELVVLAAKGTRWKLLLYVMITTAVLSSVLSNTGCVAVLLPVCVGIADAAKWNRKNLLMPLAMMASLGGTITLVGTPPNITVATVLKTFGYRSFGFYEYAFVGVPLSIVGGLVLLLIYGRGKNHDPSVIPAEMNQQRSAVRFDRKQKTALLVLLGVVAAMATGVVNLAIAATIGALICFAAKVISGQEALDDIDWTTIFLFVGTLPMATALDQSGAGKMIADAAVHLMGDRPSEAVILSVVFFIACALTQFMSNTASAALLAPIGVQIAMTLNADPHGILMTIGIASSSAFATPMATPPNTLVLGPANARFTDYIKSGLPLVLISYAVCLLIVPRVWPF